MSAATHRHATAPAAEHARLGRRARLLAAASVTYNTLEAIVAVAAGVLWQFRHVVPAERERLALRLIAVSFLALATYVTVDSVLALAWAEQPDPS